MKEEELTGLTHPTPAQALNWVRRARVAQQRLFADYGIPPSGALSGRRIKISGGAKGKGKAGGAGDDKDKEKEKDKEGAAGDKDGEDGDKEEGGEKKKEFELLRWKEPEVWYFEPTGEVFWTYE